MNKKIYLADLTHTTQGIHSPTFPLGTAFVCAHARKYFGGQFDFQLFKFPKDLSQEILEDPPAVLAFSNYSWNLELSYKLAVWALKTLPDLVVIFGGPNFPTQSKEKRQFFENRPDIDFYIENEGEVGFVRLIEKLAKSDFDVSRMKDAQPVIPNCVYMTQGRLVEGPIERILNVNAIPSPYLTGILDDFFSSPLTPLIETARGCPFSCTFCADGLESKNRVTRFDQARVREELDYIQSRITGVDEIIITDLNFGMYKEDLETAKYIARIQEDKGWPVLVKASAGKNKPERLIEVAEVLKGSWMVGSAIQSSDDEVLKNIKRDNISLDTYQDFLDFNKRLDKDAVTYTEVILGLPGDSKEKHLASLRYGIESGVDTVRAYQAILLPGTEMAEETTRKEFELLTRVRILPGAIGVYSFGLDQVSVGEMEEIIVGNRTMSLEDYLSCREMNLIVETFINNSLFEEFFEVIKEMGLATFDMLLYLHAHSEIRPSTIAGIFESFRAATSDCLYTTREEGEAAISLPEIMERYQSGELGMNELLVHKGMIYLELRDALDLFVDAAIGFLREQGRLEPWCESYFKELAEFVYLRKHKFFELDWEEDQEFQYDFKAVSDINYRVNANNIARFKQNSRFRFQFNSHQKSHIQNALNLYENTPSGIHRLIQRSNLKKMFRMVEEV